MPGRPVSRLPALLQRAFIVTLLVVAQPSAAQWSQDFWIATWATASVGRPRAVPDTDSRPASWLHVTNQTLRQIVRTSMGGSSARMVFSNAFGTSPITIGAATIAERAQGAAIKPETVRPLLFGGAASATIPPGAVLVSDPADFIVPSLGDVAIDLYLPGSTDTPSPLTTHVSSLQTSYVSATGNLAGSRDFEAVTTTRAWYLLARLEVMGTPGSATVAVLGDSITDGTASTPEANRRWTDRLAERLTAWNSRLGVANLGIAGNGLLDEGQYAYGANAQARFDRDVLALPNVQHLIVLTGINDIVLARGNPPSADDITAGYRQLVIRARSRGLRVYGATLTPFEGTGFFTPEREATRQAVNEWIRTSGVYDGVIDFDSVMRDATSPTRLRRDFDSGDHLHPNDAGYTAMGNAIPMELFGPPSIRR